jgi:hypothetical protein
VAFINGISKLAASKNIFFPARLLVENAGALSDHCTGALSFATAALTLSTHVVTLLLLLPLPELLLGDVDALDE